MLKSTIDKLLLFSILFIFASVIIYVAIVLSSITIGLTLSPLILFLFITNIISKKRANNNNE
jgi:hypothetical protein